MSLHATMIKFALDDSIYESEQRYRKNTEEIDDFTAKVSNRKDISGLRYGLEQERIKKIYDDQEKLQAILPKLAETQERFESLTPEEKKALDLRLDSQGNDLKLVLQRKNGELLALSS